MNEGHSYNISDLRVGATLMVENLACDKNITMISVSVNVKKQ